LPAFGLCGRIGGARGHLVQYEFGLIKRKLTLGPVHLLTLSQAMGKAKDVLAAVRLGKDPAAAKLEARRKAPETFGSSLDDYLEFKQAGTKPRSFTEISSSRQPTFASDSLA
jgi:Arm DNA-binding domain